MFDKQHILDEIRRTANENGGVPLGRQRFESETGIKPYDWQKYWPRFGEAQTEAGFEPNELQQAYTEVHLIELFVSLLRELGKFPTYAELRIKKRNDPSFPSHGAFEKLGSKRKKAEKILAYCGNKAGYKDIAAICDGVIEESTTQETTPDARSELELGYVYLLRSGRYYKIGKTNAAGRRERELAIQLPEKASTVHSIKTDDPSGIEAYWHKRFASKRKGGEWFDLSAEDVRSFKRRKFM